MKEYDLLDTDSGNAVVVAMDHGTFFGAVDGFQNIEAKLEAVLAAGPDAIIVGRHFARHYQDLISEHDVDCILTGDSVMQSTRPGYDDGMDVWTPAFDLGSLIELDPVGVKTVLIFGRDDVETFERNVQYTAETADRLRGTGIPLILETVMWGSRIPDELATDPEYIHNATRMGWEYGGDILKVPYTGSKESFEPIVSNAPTPTLILGGAAPDTTRELLVRTAGAMEAGSRGVMFGRSVWQSDDPQRTIEALTEIVHEGASVEESWN